MGLLDKFAGLGNLNEDQTNGLLAAAAQMLQASGPSLRPTSFGQIAGGGLGAFQAGSLHSRQRRMDEERDAQIAKMRGLQMQGMEGDLMDAQTARTTPKAPKYSTDVKVANGPDGKPIMYVMGDDGKPRIVDGLAPREAAKIMNLGGKDVAYNEFDVKPGQEFQRTQTPDSIASNQLTARGQDITMRGQNMTDSRAREFNETRVEENRQKGLIAKAPTEFQGKSAAFGLRAAEADKIINEIGDKYSPAKINSKQTVGNTWLVGGALEAATNLALTDNDQKAEQAQRDFVNAVLRQESGAAIGKDEFTNAKRQYFPQPGDGAAVIEQKARNRQLAIQGFNNNAGRAAMSAPAAPAASGGWSIKRKD